MNHHFLAEEIEAFPHPFASASDQSITSLDFLRHLGLRLGLIRHLDMLYLGRQFSYSFDLDFRLNLQLILC